VVWNSGRIIPSVDFPNTWQYASNISLLDKEDQQEVVQQWV